MKHIQLLFKGELIGITNIIPSVSGGTFFDTEVAWSIGALVIGLICSIGLNPL